jgi:hypothetical protein
MQRRAGMRLFQYRQIEGMMQALKIEIRNWKLEIGSAQKDLSCLKAGLPARDDVLVEL